MRFSKRSKKTWVFVRRDTGVRRTLWCGFVYAFVLHIMFIFRIFSLEAVFFTSYKMISIDSKNDHETYGNTLSSIEPLLQGEYRILIYIMPCIASILVNFLKLRLTSKNVGALFLKFPQFILAPAFSPFMFEGIKINGVEPLGKTRENQALLGILFC